MAEFRWDILKYKTMDYVVRYPKDYQEGEKRPILIYLHGAGGRTDTAGGGRAANFCIRPQLCRQHLHLGGCQSRLGASSPSP